MARQKTYNLDGVVPLHLIPPGVCPKCGRYCWFMHISTDRCAFCFEANCIHRGQLDWKWCVCRWSNPFCKICYGFGVVPVPKGAPAQ